MDYRPIDEVSAREVLQWKYEAPYENYNYAPEYLEEDLAYHLDPANNIYSMHRAGELVGYCSFGKDGRVPGGDYREEALDIGMMIKPQLTGQGLGSEFARDVTQFAMSQYNPKKLRVTILAANARAIHVWEKNGFLKIASFGRQRDQAPFIIMTKDV